MEIPALYLEHVDRFVGRRSLEQAVASATITQLNDFVESLHQTAAPTLFERGNSLFDQWSAPSLSGGRHPCAKLACRLGRADRLARYAALYADRVYVRNFVGSYVGGDIPEERLRDLVREDLLMIDRLRPLIAAGRIVPLSSELQLCTHCLAERLFGGDARQRVDRERRLIDAQYFQAVDLKLAWQDKAPMVVAKGPTELVDEGALLLPYPYRIKRATLDALKNGAVIPLTERRKRELLRHTLIADLWANISHELTTAQALGTAYVTDQPLHVRILSRLSKTVAVEERNAIVQRHLTTIVPVFGELALHELVALRHRESDAFISFRASLNAAIDAYRAGRGQFTETEAKQLYSDVIQPKLTLLARKVQTARRQARSQAATTVVGWAGAISFGMYTGILPDALLAAASAIGLTKVVADLIGIATKSKIDDSVRNDEMYFVWRATNAG